MSERLRMANHLVLFDGECALCHRAVRFLLAEDRKERFLYAPLQGTTASAIDGIPSGLNTLVLVENYQTDRQRLWLYGKGALRICWYLGGGWKWLGLLSFLPRWLLDPGYRLVARHRHLFGERVESDALDQTSDRILK